MFLPVTRREFGRLTFASLVSLGFPLTLVGETKSGVEWIDPLIGASTSIDLGEGKTFPGPATPFGMVQLGPDTITGGDNASGYSYEHTSIEGFSFTRMSGVGWFGDFGNLQIMPTTGAFKAASGRPEHPGEGWRSHYRHSTETAECGYYAVTLDDYQIRAEMAAAPYSGILRFTFPQSDQARIQINLPRRIGGTSTTQHVTVVDEHTVEGWMLCPHTGGGWGNGVGGVDYTVYFRMEFSKPILKCGVWSVDIPEGFIKTELKEDNLIVDRFRTDEYYALASKATRLDGCKDKEGSHIGFYTEFETSPNEQVLVKSGISFVDIEGARRNLQHDIPDWDFERVKRATRRLWSEAIEPVRIEGGTDTQRTIFATAMYHAMLDPRKISDSDGRYIGADKKVHVEHDFTYRTIFSGWDVFRGEFPLMSILRPSVVNDQICSLLELAKLSGKGYLERWEIMNAYSGCMDGDPALSVILDAYRKGIRNFNIEEAYAACRQTASGTGKQTARPNNDFYLEHGYVPDQVSWTLDNAYFDWCVGELAHDLGKEKDASIFRQRSLNYKNIYDAQLKSMRARHQDGEWMKWDGATAFGQGCTESNPLQQSWFVPHDIYGLFDLMGKEYVTSSLESFFEKTPESFGWNPYYNHSNEPVHHIPYLFVFAGKPWLTQKWVRRILDQAYHAQVNGICGNDDVGQMSAWYVLSAMGFYPVCPGTNVYILGSPLFPKVTLHPDSKSDRAFVITANNPSSSNCYVQSVKLNGRYLNRCWITHSEIVSGGTLAFEMGAAPNMAWGTGAILPPNPMTNSHR